MTAFEEHQRAWEMLARDISKLRHSVGDSPGAAAAGGTGGTEGAPGAGPGELVIIGSGIDSIGFCLGDEALIAGADKVLFCVADPATVVWLRRLRPDALDLYVLYADDKIRYTTYMEMAEAQLYWVRQGLRVVVVFYGHPGIFVLSSHRAIQIARREGHRAVMRAGVSALDTLCADLGVDPSHPGLQTHEATDCLLRRRRIDTTLHVILWQVGLIGELGYRRQGFLNNHFSYFISWLEELYGPGYEITHYIGSRYPGTDPLIGVHRLCDLHDPARQREITGLSTFYIPPRDAVPMDRQTAVDLGILLPGQPLPRPGSPRRDIASYGRREMAAFSSLARFRIPPSYHWQEETEAAKFLIELRFDPGLEELYRRDPPQALADPRFAGLSDRERSLLASRDPGSVQIAAKGNYRRSVANEELIGWLLNGRGACQDIRAALRRTRADRGRTGGNRTRAESRAVLEDWLKTQRRGPDHRTVDWAMFFSSLDFVYRNNLFPWTGVYTESDSESESESGATVTIVGHQGAREKSAVYLDGTQIRRYRFSNGTLSWPASAVPNGVMRLDLRPSSQRCVMLKTWACDSDPGRGQTVMLTEADPARLAVASVTAASGIGTDPSAVLGRYAMRLGGPFGRTVFELTVEPDGVRVDGSPVDAAVRGARLTWTGGTGPCAEGDVTFVWEPILGSVDLYGTTRSASAGESVACFGARVDPGADDLKAPLLPPKARHHLEAIALSARHTGGLLLWHKWEKASFTNETVSKHIAALI